MLSTLDYGQMEEVVPGLNLYYTMVYTQMTKHL